MTEIYFISTEPTNVYNSYLSSEYNQQSNMILEPPSTLRSTDGFISSFHY